jgi:olfactory receptor
MDKVNDSVVTEFVLLGLTKSLGKQIFLFVFFSLFYVGIILGNLLIVFTVVFGSSLTLPHVYSAGQPVSS